MKAAALVAFVIAVLCGLATGGTYAFASTVAALGAVLLRTERACTAAIDNMDTASSWERYEAGRKVWEALGIVALALAAVGTIVLWTLVPDDQTQYVQTVGLWLILGMGTISTESGMPARTRLAWRGGAAAVVLAMAFATPPRVRFCFDLWDSIGGGGGVLLIVLASTVLLGLGRLVLGAVRERIARTQAPRTPPGPPK